MQPAQQKTDKKPHKSLFFNFCQILIHLKKG